MTAIFRTFSTSRAILAVLVIIALSPAIRGDDVANQGDTPAIKPFPLQARLADGGKLRGTVTAWDRDGITGSFGRFAWTAFTPREVWRVYQRCAGDGMTAAQWLDLGRALLLTGGDVPATAKLAERAFRRARMLDEHVESAIDAIRTEVHGLDAARTRDESTRESARLRVGPPEGAEFNAQLWPALTEPEQVAALADVQARTDTLLAQAGLAPPRIETPRFLISAQLSPEDALAVTNLVGATYRTIAEVLDVPVESNVFWGKASILVFHERDRFDLVEANEFRQKVPDEAVGVCHVDGPRVFLILHRHPDDAVFRDAIVRTVTHSFMHRHVAAPRLPLWANEGFAAYIASVVLRYEDPETARRRAAIEFIRGGGSIDPLAKAKYGDDWPRPVHQGIGALLVELLILERPDAFRRWVQRVHLGEDWRKSFRDEIGATGSSFVDTAVRYYRVHD